MDKPKEIRKIIEAKAFLLGTSIALVCLSMGHVKFSFGLLTGTLSSVLNFELLRKNIRKFMRPNLRSAGIYFFTGYLFRYILIGFILWLSIHKGLSFFLGTSAGLLMVKVAIYMHCFWRTDRCKTLPE